MKRRKFTKEEIKKLKKYWKELTESVNNFEHSIKMLENMMQKDLKINDVEFFNVNGDYLGIGNLGRTIDLISLDELEKK